MTKSKFATNLALVLVGLSAWYSLAKEHKFLDRGDTGARVTPAPVDTTSQRGYQTATFALG